MKIDGDHYVLSTGRRFYAYADRLSLDGNGTLAYGYDGRIYEDPEMTDEAPFTAAERKEIAEEMIARWRKWAGDGR